MGVASSPMSPSLLSRRTSPSLRTSSRRPVERTLLVASSPVPTLCSLSLLLLSPAPPSSRRTTPPSPLGWQRWKSVLHTRPLLRRAVASTTRSSSTSRGRDLLSLICAYESTILHNSDLE